MHRFTSHQRAFFPVIISCLTLCACFGSDAGGVSAGDAGGLGFDPVTGDPIGPRDAGDPSDPRNPIGPDPCADERMATPTAPLQEVDKLDLLFVVDNSGSMAEEQAAIRAHFPNLVRVLSTGDKDGDGVAEYSAVADLNLGVVSTDMGLPGIQGIPGCGGLGNDGMLRNAPDGSIAGCRNSYPTFLSFRPDQNDPMVAARDLACIASLGTMGCGFEQPMEAALKALWPANDTGGPGAMDPAGSLNNPNRIQFLGDPTTGFGTTGHGDGFNLGFLRNDASVGLSAIAIVVVTDEEDCSSADMRHFTPSIYLDPSDPLVSQDLNLRCFFNKLNLYDIQRYVAGFKALRPANEHMVVFGAIAGVPEDLVSASRRSEVDFSDQAARDAYYAGILDDTRMNEIPDPTRPPDQGNLTPSCQTANGNAYPPRRMVEVAREFGQNGFVQSICSPDLGPAMDVLVETVARRPGVGQSDGPACP